MNHRVLPLDPARRYLVVGDIHGRHATFTALLESLGYDPDRDTVCSVGDLIDRGPDPVSTLAFFEQAHCHAVRGNHEQMVVNPGRWRGTWLDPRHGGPTTLAALERHDRDLRWLRTTCESLPICLDVGEEDEPGAFRLIHAESPFDWCEADLAGFLAEATSIEIGESRLLWSREDIRRVQRWTATGSERHAIHPDPGRSRRTVFCGHTPTHQMVGACGTHWIDTWAGGFLTCVDPATMREYRMSFLEADRL